MGLEQRVAALEARYAEILELIQHQPARNAWRQVVGMFADDPRIEELHQETRRIREKNRDATREKFQGDS